MKRALALALLGLACSQRDVLPPPTLPLTPTPDADFRAHAPVIEPSPPNVPEVRSAELENGLTVLVVERSDLPLVSLAFASRAAHDESAPSEHGLAALTARVLNEGTRYADGTVLRRLHVGASYPVVRATAEGTSVQIGSLANGVEGRIHLLSEFVKQPAFEPAGLEAARSDLMNDIYYQSLSVRYELRNAAMIALHGPDHPAAGEPLGRSEDVSRFTMEAVEHFYRTHYAPETSELVAVGAVTQGEVVALARRYFGDWSRSAQAPAQIVAPVTYPSHSTQIQGLETADPEARFTLALPCPVAADPRGVDFDLLAMVLANLSMSRSQRLLRHEQGISPAIEARCEQHAGYGTFWVDFAVDTERGGDALATVLGEIQRLRTTLVSPSELSAARQRLLAEIAARVSSDESLAHELVANYLRGVGPDDYVAWVRLTQAATAEQLRASAARYFAGHVGIATYGIHRLLEPGLVRFGGAQWWRLRPQDEY
jgi:zinc protease